MRNAHMFSLFVYGLVIARAKQLAMEAQISELTNLVKAMSDGQKVLITRLDQVENEISGLRTPVNDNSARNSGEGISPLSDGDATLQHSAVNFNGPPCTAGTALQHGTEHVGAGATNIVSVQDEFSSIKDKYNAVKIPQELRVGNSRNGIKREDNVAAKIIVNSAKYVETSLKLLWNLDETASKNDLIELFNIQKAHVDYLREEHSALVVAGQFGVKTSQLFRNLSRGNTNLDDKHLDTLLKAVQITSNENCCSATASQRGARRGRGYSFGYNSGRAQRPFRGGWTHQRGSSSSSGGGTADSWRASDGDSGANES